MGDFYRVLKGDTLSLTMAQTARQSQVLGVLGCPENTFCCV